MEPKKKLLPLPYPAEGMDKPVVCGTISYCDDLRRKKEPAGHFYEQFYRDLESKKAGTYVEEKPVSSDDDAEGDEEDKKEETAHAQEWEKKKKGKAEIDEMRAKIMDNDLYEVLGLGDIALGATMGQIKTAYRKLALRYHPDKQEDKQAAETDPRWLKILDAYETLTDPVKRKKYDSSREFDDTIPEVSDVSGDNFYDVFAVVFRRNSIWSVRKNIPDLGDESTDMKEVHRFYNFWRGFQSWRDFSIHDEYNPEEAENRYERRWMEKENKKTKAKYLAMEKERIKTLTERAYSLDPRIIAEQQEEERIRQERIKEKKEERERARKVIEDAKRKRREEEEEKKRKEQEEAERVKQEKRKKKEEMATATERLLNLTENKIKDDRCDRFYVEEAVKVMTKEQINEISDKIDAAKASACKDLLINFVNDCKRTREEKLQKLRSEEKKKNQTVEEEKKISQKWSREELASLTKAVAKFPPGASNRWGQIAKMVGNNKTEKECIERAKNLNRGAPAVAGGRSKMNDTDRMRLEAKKAHQAEIEKKRAAEKSDAPKVDESGWSVDQQKQLELALRKYPASMKPDERWSAIAGDVEGKSKKECVMRFKEIRARLAKKD